METIASWLATNWFGLVQTGAIFAVVLLLRQAILRDARIRQIGNSIQLTEQHRTLWERLISEKELSRVLAEKVNLSRQPITQTEEMFVVFLILHLSDSFYAIETGFYPRPEGIAKDVKQLFSLPIPKRVWKKVRGFQDAAFVQFVDRCLDAQESDSRAT